MAHENEGIVMRELTMDEFPLLRDSMVALADHHNRIAEIFPGVYPIVAFDRQLERLREKAEKGEGKALGLFSGGEIRGYAIGYVEGDKGILENLHVDSSLRRGGHGAKLVAGILDFMREHSVELVDLHVVKGNDARAFYEKQGFEVRAFVMAKKLG